MRLIKLSVLLVIGIACLFYFKDSFVLPNLAITINGYTYEINTSDTPTRLEGKSFSSETSNNLIAPEFDESKYELYVNDKRVLSMETRSLALEHLSSAEKITIRFVERSNAKEFHTYISTIPSSFKGIFTTSTTYDKHYYYFSLDNILYKMNEHGNVIYFKQESNPVTSFKLHRFGEEKFYSYLKLNGEEIRDPVPGLFRNHFSVVLMSDNFQTVEIIKNLYPSELVQEEVPISVGGFIMLGKGHYLLKGYMPKLVTNIPEEYIHNYDEDGVKNNIITQAKLNEEKAKASAYQEGITNIHLCATVVQEVKDGKVIFEWDSTNYPEMYSYNRNLYNFMDFAYELNNPNPNHYVYAIAESMFLSSDQNIMLSFNAFDSVMKINRKSGSIMNILGGKGNTYQNMKDEQCFMGQHSVSRGLKENEYIVFSNGTVNPRRVGTTANIMRFVLDDKENRITDFEYTPINLNYCFGMGNAEMVGEDEYLIAWGYTTVPVALFTEYNTQSKFTKFEINSADEMHFCYDAFRAVE